MRRQKRRHDATPATQVVGGRAVDLRTCCDLIGLSVRTGERRLAEGRFQIPHLPRAARRGSPYRFSTYDIEWYLQNASTHDARVRTSKG